MNLSESIGATLLLQFRGPMFLCAPGPDGRPNPIMHNLPEETLKQMAASGNPPFASALFLVADLEKADEEQLIVHYETDAAPGHRVKLTIPVEMVLFASEVSRVMAPSRPGIVLPS